MAVLTQPDDWWVDESSMVIVNGYPAVAFSTHGGGQQALGYVRATDPTGLTWSPPIIVATVGGSYPSMAIVDGNPAIAYADAAVGLKYVRASDVNGESWGTPVLVHAGAYCGYWGSMAVVNGHPAVAYTCNTGPGSRSLYYVRANDPIGSSWGAPQGADSDGGDAGVSASLAVVAGYPAIAHWDFGHSDLKYVRALDPNGAVWGTPLRLDAELGTGANPSLAIINGNPAIAYRVDYGYPNHGLMYIRAADAIGSSWGTSVLLDSGDMVAFDTITLLALEGKPAIAYGKPSRWYDIRYVEAQDADGVVWKERITVASGGMFPSAAVVSGRAAIAFRSGHSLAYIYNEPPPPPVADANGPYAGDEGSAISINGAGSSGESIEYAWDCTDDGSYDVIGTSPTGSACTYADNGDYVLRLRVTDAEGATAEDTANVTVNNVAPVAAFGNNGRVYAGQNFALALTDPVDPSSADTETGFTYAFDCGDDHGYAAFTAANTRVCATDAAGVRTVKGKIQDKNGGETEYVDTVAVNETAGLTFVVTKAADDNGACTVDDCALREAVIAANANIGVDTILVPVLVDGPYVLSLTTGSSDSDFGDLDVTDDVKINGQPSPGKALPVIDANQIDRVFELASAGGVIELDSLVVKQGHSDFGGCVRVEEGTEVKITSSFISHCSAVQGGGLANDGGFVSIRRSTISYNSVSEEGGGVLNYGFPAGTMTIEDSTIANNTGGWDCGGAIDNWAPLTVRNSTIVGNSASEWGVVSDRRGKTSIVHSTIAGNTCGGGSVVLGNLAFDILGDNPGCSDTPSRLIGAGGATVADCSGQDPAVCPGLGAYRVNEQPGQGRFPLLVTSLAVDSGDANDCPVTDQLGRGRVDVPNVGATVCDIGAIEFQLHEPPEAEAGGPYTGAEGSIISLDASASTGENITEYAWDCTNDGTYEATSASPTGSTCTYADDGSFVVRLRVTDAAMQTAEDTADVTVNNVAPQATFVYPTTPVVAGDNFTLRLNDPTDPSTVDSEQGYFYAFDCGDGVYSDWSGPWWPPNDVTIVCFTTGPVELTVRGKIKDKDAGETEYTGLIVVEAAPSEPVFDDGFESGDFSEWSGAVTGGGDLSVTAAAAYEGNQGMQAVINDDTSLYVRDFSPVSELEYAAGFAFDPNAIVMASNDMHYIFAGRMGSVEVFRVLFRRYNNNYQVRAQVRDDAGAYTSGAWYTISDAYHVIEIEWRAATAAETNNGSLSLRLDGAPKETMGGLDNDTLRVEEVRLGPLAGIDTGTRGVTYFDGFESWRPSEPTPTSTPSPTGTHTPGPPTNTYTPTFTPTGPTKTPTRTPTVPAGDVIFADSFESGNFSAWSGATTGGGDLSVTAAAAMKGGKGMQANINDNTSLYVKDTRPANETRYNARFYFDPNSIAMVSGDAHNIFTGRMGTADVLRVVFRRYNTAYQVRVQIRTDAATYTSGTWYAITDGAHAVEIEWKAAKAAGANNGAISLWIDGVAKQTKGSIDNDTLRVDEVRLGPSSGIDAGTRGVTYFDAFESRRTGYIGQSIGPDSAPAETGRGEANELMPAEDENAEAGGENGDSDLDLYLPLMQQR